MSSQVQGTNDSSILSKYSMVLQGYFKDEYIQYFVAKKARRSPLINIGYYVRAVVVEKTLMKFIETFHNRASQMNGSSIKELRIILENCVGQTKNMIGDKKNIAIIYSVIGAGFDTSVFRLLGLPGSSEITFFEVDLPDVVARKSAVIKSNPVLSDKIKNIKVDCGKCGIWSDNYHLLAADLRQLSDFERLLNENGFDSKQPTLLLAECSITYMDEISSKNLIEFTQRLVHDAVFITYEQISPHDPFGVVMIDHFLTINSPLLSVGLHQSLQAQERRFKAQGWSSCHAVSVWEALTEMTSEKERLRVLSLEPFDEWEEWHLKCNHYALVVASKGLLNSWTPLEEFKSSLKNEYLVPQTFDVLELRSDNLNIRQYGHSSSLVSKSLNELLIINVGGFGQIGNSSHKRLNKIRCIKIDNRKVTEIDSFYDNKSGLSVMHHSCCIFNDYKSLLLYGGRESPLKCAIQTPLLITYQQVDDCVHFVNEELVTNSHNTLQIKPRWRHSTCVIDDNVHTTFVIFGGCSTNLEVFGDMWKIDLDGKCNFRWVEVPLEQEFPCPRFSHSATVANGNMYISGGLNSKFEALSDVWVWNFDSEKWKRLVDNVIPRYGHTSHFVGSTLILVGGVSTVRETWPGVALINTVTLKSIELDLACESRRSTFMLQNHSSVLHGEKSIYIIGGGGNCFSFGTKFNDSIYELPLSQWILN